MVGMDHSEVEARFSQMRRKLDDGGYLESFGLDSLRLVEHLFGDLVKTTESLQKTLVEYSQYKKVADELECGVAPFKDENVRLHKENSVLRVSLVKAFEEAEDKTRDPSSRLRDLEAENNDLKLLVSQFAERVKRVEAESLEKTKRIIRLQEKELGPTVTVKGEVRKTMLNQKPSMEVNSYVTDACPQCIRLRNFVEYGKNSERNPRTADYVKLADSRIEALQLQLRSFKNLEKEHLTLIASLKSRVDTRESEIERLRDLIKVRPGRDNKINSAVSSYKTEDSDLIGGLKSAEMQLQIIQRRNVELEEKLKKSILQEHQDFMLGKTPAFYSEGNAAKMFLEKELDKYPSHDKMTLLEKLYYLERQLSHCCKEKAVLKKQIEECKLKHTLFEDADSNVHSRQMSGKVKIKEKSAIYGGLKTTSNSLRNFARGSKPVKANEEARTKKHSGQVLPKPEDLTQHDHDNEFQSSASASLAEDDGAEVSRVVADEESPDYVDKLKKSANMSQTNQRSFSSRQTKSVSGYKGGSIKSKDRLPFPATNTKAGHSTKATVSSFRNLKGKTGQRKFDELKSKPLEDDSENGRCESPMSAEYSNSEDDFSDNASDNCDDDNNGNVEHLNMPHVPSNVKSVKHKVLDKKTQPLPSPNPSEQHDRVPKNPQTFKTNRAYLPAGRPDSKVTKDLHKKIQSVSGPNQASAKGNSGKLQKLNTKSKGRVGLIKSSSAKSSKRNDDQLEDVQEEEQEDVEELEDASFAEYMDEDNAIFQTSDQDRINKRKSVKNVPDYQTNVDNKNMHRASAGQTFDSKKMNTGRKVHSQTNRPDITSMTKTVSNAQNAPSLGDTAGDGALNESSYAYYEEDDEYSDNIPSNFDGDSFVKGQQQESSNYGHRHNAGTTIGRRDIEGSDNASLQATNKGSRYDSQSSLPKRGVQDRTKGQGNERPSQNIVSIHSKTSSSTPPSQHHIPKSTASTGSKSLTSTNDKKMGFNNGYMKDGEKNKGISSVKEPSLLSISEFERDQSDDDSNNDHLRATEFSTDGVSKPKNPVLPRRDDPSSVNDIVGESRSSMLAKRGSSVTRGHKNLSGESSTTEQQMRRKMQPLEADEYQTVGSSQNYTEVLRRSVEREFNRGGGDDPIATFGDSSEASYTRKVDNGRTRYAEYMRGGVSVARPHETIDENDRRTIFKSEENQTYGGSLATRVSVRSVGVNTENQNLPASVPWREKREDSPEKRSLVDKITTLQRKLDDVHAESSRHQLKSFELQGELERTKHMLQVEKQERDLAVSELKRVRELNNESTARMLMNSALGSDGSFRRGTTPMEMEREIVNLRGALASLDRDKDEMRIELDRKDERLARLTNDVSKYMDEISQLKLRLKNAELQISHTGESAKEQTREVDFLKKQLESNRRDLEKTIRERDEALKELHKLSAVNAKGQMERRSVESELELKNKEADDLRRQVQRYIDEVRRIEELLLDKEEEMETIIQHYRSLTHENNNLEAQRTSLEREASSIRESVRDAVDQNISFKTTLASQNALIQTLEEEIQNLTQQISQLENQLESKSEKEKMLESDVKASKDLIYRLEVQMDKLKLDVADNESKRKQLEAENFELNTHISALEARLNDETERQEQLESLVANSREKDFQLEKTTLGMSRERDELVEKLTSLQQRSETLSSEVSRYRLKSIELQNDLDRTRRQLDNEKRERETALTELRRVREQLNTSSANYLLNTALGTTGSSGSQLGGNITDSSIQHATTTPSSGSTFRQNLLTGELLPTSTSREQSPFATSHGTPFDSHLDPPMASSTSRKEEEPGPSTSFGQSKSIKENTPRDDDEFEEWDSPVK